MVYTEQKLLKKEFNRIIVMFLVISHISIYYVNSQYRQEYYCVGISLSGGTHENNIVNKLTTFKYSINLSYISRYRPQIFSMNMKNQQTKNNDKNLFIGYGFRANASHDYFKNNDFKVTNNSIGVTPVLRLFLLQKGFLEFGYSLMYFKYDYSSVPNISPYHLYTFPRQKGFKSGISIGIGYIFELSDVIAIEPLLTYNPDYYINTEVNQVNTKYFLNYIRMVININFINNK